MSKNNLSRSERKELDLRIVIKYLSQELTNMTVAVTGLRKFLNEKGLEKEAVDYTNEYSKSITDKDGELDVDKLNKDLTELQIYYSEKYDKITSENEDNNESIVENKDEKNN